MEAKLGLALVKICEFPFIYSYFLPIILGIFLWRKKQLSRPAIYLVVYIMVLFLEDYFHGFFAVLYRNNLWVGRIGLYFETLFVALFFGYYLKEQVLRRIYFVCTVVCLSVITYFNTKADWMEHVDLELLIYYINLFIVVTLYYIQVYKDEQIQNIFFDLGFLVGSVLIISVSFVLLHNLFYNFTAFSQDSRIISIYKILSNINIYKIIGYNILFTVVLWVTRVSPK